MRKTDADLRATQVVEEFEAESLVMAEIANDVYYLQDDETRRVIDKVIDVLRASATGELVGVATNVSDDAVKDNTLWLAVEIVKDLSMVGLQVANFTMPSHLCANCGSDV